MADTAVKGLIIPDLPHEHANFVEPFLADTDMGLIPLVSLTTGIERQKELIKGAEGFVYAVAVNGVTGKSGNYRADLDKHLAQLHQVADIPVLTGLAYLVKRCRTLQCGVRWCYRWFENCKKLSMKESRFRTLSNKQ